jgi:hypothetical protein
MPAGFLCNPGQPRCPFESTPVDGTPNASPQFAPLGGSQIYALYCTPYTVFTSGYGGGTQGRPAKGGTVFSPPPKDDRPIPPLYRNPYFFTGAGQPKTTACTGASTGYTTQNRTRFGANKGKVQVGKPLAGTWDAVTGTMGSFSFRAAALKANNGLRARTTGEFTNIYPYIYSYTYADFANDAGLFGAGQGIGTFTHKYIQGANTVARINVTPGPSRFGGTMRLLGQMTTKRCYYRNGGCLLSERNWRYDVVGASAPRPTPNGPVTAPHIVTNRPTYYCIPESCSSTYYLIGSRFPWTTGMVTVTARKRGEFKTVHYATGYDNRNPVTGKGTIQLVSPVMTRWLQPAYNLETAGIGLLRIVFVPEPQTWVVLVAGASLLCVGARMRRRWPSPRERTQSENCG